MDGAGHLYELLSLDEVSIVVCKKEKNGTYRIRRYEENMSRVALTPGFVPLGLSALPILEKKPATLASRAAKGLRGMSSRMKKMLRSACVLLEEKHTKDRLAFLTLTVPDVPDDVLASLWENWDSLVNQLTKYLKYHAEKKGTDFEFVYCTEIQPSRLRKTGRAFPHLHLVYPGKPNRKCPWDRTPRQIRRFWTGLLRKFSVSLDRDSPCENLQVVRKSAGSYLSKYLSKGGNSSTGNDGCNPALSRGIHWGGMSRSLSARVRERILKKESSPSSPIPLLFTKCLPILAACGVLRYRKFLLGYASRDGDSGYEYRPLGYSGFFMGRRIPDTCDEIASVISACRYWVSSIYRAIGSGLRFVAFLQLSLTNFCELV
jgi:hypothetical protein